MTSLILFLMAIFINSECIAMQAPADLTIMRYLPKEVQKKILSYVYPNREEMQEYIVLNFPPEIPITLSQPRLKCGYSYDRIYGACVYEKKENFYSDEDLGINLYAMKSIDEKKTIPFRPFKVAFTGAPRKILSSYTQISHLRCFGRIEKIALADAFRFAVVTYNKDVVAFDSLKNKTYTFLSEKWDGKGDRFEEATYFMFDATKSYLFLGLADSAKPKWHIYQLSKYPQNFIGYYQRLLGVTHYMKLKDEAIKNLTQN